MATKERYQNPVVGDDLTLRLFVYNSNHPQSVNSVEKVEIFFLQPGNASADNPDGRRLVATVEGADVTLNEEGEYSASVAISEECFVIGKYVDVWTIKTREDDPTSSIGNYFEVYPDLWYTSPIPIVYSFSFAFRPNRLRKGSKQYLIADVTPNVPRGSDLERYYRNLAIVSPLRISIEAACVECQPTDPDLALIVDNESVEFRDKGVGYFFLDTEALEMGCGMYNVWFEMELGKSKYISDKQQLQIFT